MKYVFVLICLVACFGGVYAQEEVTFSEEELTKYATVMAWAEEEKSKMTGIYNGWINNDENLAAARFSKIRKAKGDSVQLQELEVSAEEIKAFEKIQMGYDSMITSFKEVYTGKIKSDIGAGLYNSLKKGLKKDAELKDRYNNVLEGIKAEAKEEDESEE